MVVRVGEHYFHVPLKDQRVQTGCVILRHVQLQMVVLKDFRFSSPYGLMQ